MRNAITNHCIYLKNCADGLTYTSQEHIFPAAIGGSKKLANGLVSDQANHAFSNIERKAFHNSTIRLNRQMYGIGKRGKRSDRAVAQSAPIELLQHKERKEFCLGFFMKAIPIVIVQYHIDLCNMQIIGVTLPPDNINLDVVEFAKTHWSGYCEVLIGEKLNSRAILGYHENKWYLAVPNNESVEMCKQMVESTLLRAADFLKNDIVESISQVSADIKGCFDENYYRVIAKVAFNYLAYICGQEVALRDDFDGIRNYILNGGDDLEFIRPFVSVPKEDAYSAMLASYENHFVRLQKVGLLVLATVSIFGLYSFVVLSENSSIRINDYGYVCDTKRQVEMSAGQYLHEYVLRTSTTNA